MVRTVMQLQSLELCTNDMTIFQCLDIVLDRAQKHTLHGMHTRQGMTEPRQHIARQSMTENVSVSRVLYLRIIG
jgi:hypothetical protein